MCRIAGSINVPDWWIEKAILHQHSGGPDYKNWTKVTDNINFGHNLLSIIGHCQQPIANDRYVMTFNGCIYNYQELYPYSGSDTMAAIHHFRMKGVKAVDDFNGMFAIGLYDKVEQEIHLFVDRFGQKPIYYFHEGNRFAFASSPAALYSLQDKWEIDKDALQSYWLLGSVMGEDGMMKGIKKLTASQHLTYSVVKNEVKIECYWEPKFQENTSVIKDLVIDAIDKVKVSDVPVHIFLSGGIDSTLVASRFAGRKAIHLDSPERSYAEEAARRFHVELNVINPEEIETEKDLLNLAIEFGEPLMAGLIPYITSKEVSKFGKVAITANGADELFFGYDRTSEFLTPKQSHHILRGSLAEFWDSPSYLFGNRFDAPGYSVSERMGNGRIFELSTYVQFDLNKTLDATSMCHGLEMRSPFLDHRLVEMALSIPEKEHRKQGNKTILKEILWDLGFSKQFTNRPKIGFSLHKQPKNMPELIEKAWKWVHSEGFLNVNHINLSGRDRKYIEMSALSFYFWYDAWKHKIA